MSHSPGHHASQRSDPSSALLDAVRQRETDEVCLLLDHWVHRHGLEALQRFRATRLNPELGSEADSWLESVLLLGREAGNGLRSPAAEAGALPAASSPDSTAPAAWVPDFRAHDLPGRAEAAMKAAFAALEDSFPSAAVLQQQPEPEPDATGLAAGWPAASVDPDGWRLPPELHPSPSALGMDPSCPDPSGDLRPTEAAETVIPSADDPDPAEDRRSDHGVSLEAPSPAPFEAVVRGGGAAWIQVSGLWQRLERRGSRGLQQLRAVMRDCLEETVSPWRASDGMEDSAPWSFGDETGPMQTPSPAAPLRPTARPVAEAGSSRSVSTPSAPASWTRTAEDPGVSPRRSVAIPAGQGRPAAVPQPSMLAGLRIGPARRQSQPPGADPGRPAPAPAALSDLRAWLPAAEDLPRAS